MPNVCYNYKGVHIPGCMGCAVYGHHACTCPPRKSPEYDLIKYINRLEKRIEKLERLLQRKPRNAATLEKFSDES